MKANSKLSIIPENIVIDKIHELRGHKVMLDSDLADLYGVETKRLNEQVRRNIDRFPDDFMFKLTINEWQSLRSQFATSKTAKGGRTYLPNVFTEHGVLMLSSVLNSQQAIQVNIQIVRVFAGLKKKLHQSHELKLEVEEIKKKLNSQDKNIALLFNYIENLIVKKAEPRKRIGFKPDDL